MVYHNLNTEQTNKFKKEIRTNYKRIKNLEIKYSIPSICFNYSFEKTSEDEMFDIFYETKNLIQNEDFQKDFFKKFFKTYFKKESDQKIYPKAYVQFDFNNDGEYEYQFYSMYYKQSYNSGEENEIDGYKTWTYWDFKNEPKPVPEKK